MPARAFTTYRSAGPVLPEFLSNLKNLFKVAYIYPYDVSAARTQNSKDFFTVKVILMFASKKSVNCMGRVVGHVCVQKAANCMDICIQKN